MYLQNFNYEVIHRQGKINARPNALSQMKPNNTPPPISDKQQ